MAFTDGLTDAGGRGGYSVSQSLPDLIGLIITAVLSVLGVILLVLIIYAGFIWMTAAGDDKKIKKAKDILAAAVVGSVIVISSYAISTFVIGALQNTLNSNTAANNANRQLDN